MFGFLIPLLTQLFVSLVVSVIAYALLPKPKATKSDAARDLVAPTAEAGRPIPVAFGEITIAGVNYIATMEKSTIIKEVKA
jgi:hypothetical protein